MADNIIKPLATEETLAAISAKLPSTGATGATGSMPVVCAQLPTVLGATASAGSLSVVPATDADLAKASANGPTSSLYWPAQVYAGTGATGGTGPAQFAAHACSIGAWFQGDPDNTDNVAIGPSDVALSGTVKGRPLTPGEEVFVPCANTNQVYHCGETGSQKINVRGA